MSIKVALPYLCFSINTPYDDNTMLYYRHSVVVVVVVASHSIQASCIDSTAPPEAVFAREVKKLQAEQLKPQEQVGYGW